jgi:hypothetical protein
MSDGEGSVTKHISLRAGDRYRFVGIDGADLYAQPSTIGISSVSFDGNVFVIADFPPVGSAGASVPLSEVVALIEHGIWEFIDVDEAEGVPPAEGEGSR